MTIEMSTILKNKILSVISQIKKRIKGKIILIQFSFEITCEISPQPINKISKFLTFWIAILIAGLTENWLITQCVPKHMRQVRVQI